METASDYIKKFQDFVESEIDSAVVELAKIKAEKNRKNLQRLVYTNLVNRFDVLLDNLLLLFASNRSSAFSNMILNEVKDVNVSTREFLETMLSDDPRAIAKDRIEDLARTTFLRKRHSKKLRYLLERCFNVAQQDLDKPRVNASDGRIHSTYKKKDNKVPASVIGYADYLYSRRNGLIHGSGTPKLLAEDAAYLKRIFNVAESKNIALKLSSIKSAATYYNYLCVFLLTGHWSTPRGW